MSDSNIQEKLKALTTAYLAQLPGRASEINDLMAKVTQESSWGEHGKSIYRHVHSLAGSGASFGFKQLSESARALELCLQRCMQVDKLGEEQQQEISPLLADLMRSINDATQSEK